MGHYEYFEHTADLGIISEGSTYPETVEYAARALFNQICSTEKMSCTQTIHLNVQSDTPEDRAVQFLNQLLLQFVISGFVPIKYNLRESEVDNLDAVLEGDTFDPDRDESYQEIKAVTYHQLRLDTTPTGYRLQLVADL